jgi:hypothetical protein
VDDQQLWNLGTVRLKCLLADFSGKDVLEMTQLLTRYRKAKDYLAAVVAEVNAASDCRTCGGQCCLNGKYRINVFDAIARIAAQIPTATDFSQKPVCPYGGDAGCTMEPGLRPADCVVFICDAIDRKLSPQARYLFAAEEQVLRECIRKASILTDEQMGTPFLLWVAKNNTSKSKA